MVGLERRQDAERAIASAMSELGAMAVAVSGGVVTDVRFGYRTCAAAAAGLARSGPQGPASMGTPRDEDGDRVLAESVLERLVRYAEGEPVELDDVPTAVGHLSAFQRRVVQACRAIPRGERRTYGQLAAAAGSPGAARAVGGVMAGNRVPLVVPCHRVVGVGGKLGGFSAPQGLRMKRRLLELEGAMLFS